MKETLGKDAYFTGYLAAKALDSQNSPGVGGTHQVHLVITISVLVLSIFCQWVMIYLMRTEHQRIQDDAWTEVLSDLMHVNMIHPVKLQVEPWIFLAGLFVFFLQCQVEWNQVSVLQRAILTEEFPKAIWPWNGACSTCNSSTPLRVLSGFLILCKGGIPAYLAFAGTHVLSRSGSNMDVVLNCTALAFVFKLDDLAMKAVCPTLTAHQTASFELFKESLKQNNSSGLDHWTGWKLQTRPIMLLLRLLMFLLYIYLAHAACHS